MRVVFGFTEAIIVRMTFATTECTPSIGVIGRLRALVSVAIMIVIEVCIVRFVVVVEIAVVGIASTTATSVATSARVVERLPVVVA